jgi:hypothetical protein
MGLGCKKLYIFGITNFAKMICLYLHDQNIHVDGFMVDEKYITEEIKQSSYPAPIISWENFKRGGCTPQNSSILPVVGYNGMNSGR